MDLSEMNLTDEERATIARAEELTEPAICSSSTEQITAEHVEMKGVLIPALIGIIIGKRIKK